MAHELIDVVTATPTGPIEIGIGQTIAIGASFTLDGPTDATVSVYGLTWLNTTLSLSFGTEFGVSANTVYSKNFTGTTVGTFVLRVQASFNSDATPPNDNQTVDSNDITVIVRRFREEEGATTSWVEENPSATTAMTEERAPGSITFTENSPATGSWAEESPPAAGQGTAYIHVDTGDETTVGDYDLYVCENAINGTLMDASTPPMSLKLCYTIATEIPKSVAAFWVALRLELAETDYFHTSLIPYDDTTRLDGDAGLWLLKPSAALGQTMGEFYAANVPVYFDGSYADQSFGTLPDYYWNAYLTAADLVGTRPTWEANLDAHMAAFFAAFKAAVGTEKAVIGNTAGATFSGIDGITIEDSKIIAMGEAAALAAFETQRLNWVASANRYGSDVLNIAWDYDLNVAHLVYQGTTTGDPIPETPTFIEEG